MSKTALAFLLIFIAAALAVFVWLKFSGNSANQIASEPPSASPSLALRTGFSSDEIPSAEQSPTPSLAPNSPLPSLVNSGGLSAPFDRWQERVTKKPFGIFVSPNNSPVSPEKFTGYHTGVDFETFSDEQDKDVTVSTVCAGPLLLKESASGYGGVAVQDCMLGNQDVTIIYGHLQLSSIQGNIGQQLSAGAQIGILGKGYSSETDGERKHLHLGIHVGKAINILGYVQKQADLAGWMDATQYF